MAIQGRFLNARAGGYLLLLLSQAFFVFAGIVGSACHEESSPSTAWKVPDKQSRHPDGGINATSSGLGSDVVFPKAIQIDSVDRQVTWNVSNQGDALVIPFRESNGDLRLSISRGSVKPGKQTTVKMSGTYKDANNKTVAITQYLPVHAQ